MFPSSGYFRGVPCPYFASGLCERPYCHFRHSRTEVERSSKTAETGPSYSTSTTPSLPNSSFLNAPIPSSSIQSTLNVEQLSGIASYSTRTSTAPHQPFIEAYETKGNALDTGQLSLSIPSFSSTVPTLPESDHEPPVSVESMPPISGLPKTRKTLPSYTPTPKPFNAKPLTVPSYIPTPKSVGDTSGKTHGHVIEYDPVKSYAISDKDKSSLEEEPAFSDEDDELPGANNASDKRASKAAPDGGNQETAAKSNGLGGSAAAEDDDLTDSDEDVGIPTRDEESISTTSQKESRDFSELLTPSSFFKEKLALASSSSNTSCSNNKVDSTDPLRGDNSNSEESHRRQISDRSSSTKLSSTSNSKSKVSSSHKSSPSHTKMAAKSSSHKSSSTHSKSSPSSSHKSSLSSSDLKKTTSSHKSAHSVSSSSSSKDRSAESKSSSSSSLTSSKKTSAVSSSSSSHKDSKNNKSSSSSSLHVSSSSSKAFKSSSSAYKRSSSSSPSPSSSNRRDSSSHHSKDRNKTSEKKAEEKTPSSSSSTALKKPHSSSSEKENTHLPHHGSKKSHSLSRGLSMPSSSSSSSQSSSSKHHTLAKIRPERSKSDEKTRHAQVDRKPSVFTNQCSKSDSKPAIAMTSESASVKTESNSLENAAKLSEVHFKLTNSNSVKEDRFASNSGSKQLQKTKRGELCKKISMGPESDSDVEIIEPPPVPVYSISDSDDSDGDICDKQGKKEDEDKSSDVEFSVNDVDLMSDADTFDECLRIFQESERQMAEKLKHSEEKFCPEKRKAHEAAGTFESSDDLLASVGKKRMAHADSAKISRRQKAVAASVRPRLSPAQVMHNRIIEMQKRALLRAARREGRESDLPSMVTNGERPSSATISVIGGGLPANPSFSKSNSSSSSSKVSLSPSLLPKTCRSQHQVYTPSTSSIMGNKTPPRKSTSVDKNGSVPFSLSPNTFFGKKKPLASNGPKNVTTASTASKTEKRKAHEPTMSNLKRPLIPAEFGSKVPTNVRQRYLNLIIDEHLKFRPEEEAFTKGEEDEKAVYEKATNKNIYLRVAVNAIKRIRTEAAQVLPSTSKKPRVVSAPGLSGPMAQSHAATLGGPNALRHSYTLNRSRSVTSSVPEKIHGRVLYERLKTYILTETQLRENGYPRPSDNGSSKAQFYKEDAAGILLKENERICRRCGNRFNVAKDGEPISNGLCVYHYGNAYKKKVSGTIESRYVCCNERAGTKGCQVAVFHVHERNKTDNRSGYMKTMPASPTSEKNNKVYSLDCEMVYTKAGLELARVTVIGEDCQVVYETLVKPDTDIIDYNTRFSGITAADMKGVTTDIRGVQAVMLSMISDKTILMGHSLESDLVALKLIHSTVVDTSLVFPHRLGLPYKRALRHLMLDHLHKIIQSDEGGHDSKEDAVACMQLMLYKVKEDAKKELRRN
ncbi:RNA exonuclease 1-like protein [Plakobranchus ocellatus]|uniref:RNA exonuclease 1-like protein n=1 Tax=Plakobranchus ocellatus TaxID=259542 RepID=A0AAV3ZI93_9GAST|nr:RNA exonuclease 1-like protein [Plakobranchus ocellatus]